MTSNSNSNARDSIAVFGGTGPSGELVVREALSRGYDVVMYARSPGKIPEDLKENSRVRIVEGTLEQGGKIAEAVRGTVAVISCLGPLPSTPSPFRAKSTPIADGTRTILKAMKEEGVKKFIGLGTPSINDPRDNPSILAWLMVTTIKLLARYAYDDIVGVGEAAKSAPPGLTATIARVPLLMNGAKSSQGALVGQYGDGESLRVVLRRADLAHFMCDAVRSDEWDGKMPAITN